MELVEPEKKAARTDDVKKVITMMQNSPTAAFLRDCSLHERIMLASLLKCVKRDGIEEIRWDDVSDLEDLTMYLYSLQFRYNTNISSILISSQETRTPRGSQPLGNCA